jgi:sialate O-acetylesterase
VLDIGSFNVNGKPDAMGLDYVGLDMRAGPNVDIVCNAHRLPFGDAEFDGVVWLRKTITLSADESKEAAILELSTIDDDDITFTNGLRVGSTTGWNKRRKYVIPRGVLKEGKNVIAIRVTDNGGGGGLSGSPADLRLVLENSIIPLGGAWKFQVESIKIGPNQNEFPSLAYNAMINPLIPYSFRGVLWYQGESNAGRADQYRKAFPLLISDWRQKWNRGNFPFYFVQLATFSTPGNSNDG